MDRYKNLQKIEFVLTYACTGNCKHCSQGEHTQSGACLDTKAATDCIKMLVKSHKLKTALVFGGEPLLFADSACEIIACARECGIQKRQVITNGYFTRDKEKMQRVAKMLYECGVNDLLLSADAFHQETIPIEIVKQFATELKFAGVPTRIQPAWLVSEKDDNPYNKKTREIVNELCALGFEKSDGNVIFFEGNAQKYLADYFKGDLPKNPYIEDESDVRCISVDPKTDILNVMEKVKRNEKL